MTEPELLGDIHFWIGCGALVSGFTAFAAEKGKKLHRGAGTVFVISMGLLSISGLWLSLAREILFTVFLSAISFHALITGWAAARGTGRVALWLIRAAPLFSAMIMVGAITGGLQASAMPMRTLNGLPPEAFYLLAGIGGLLCVLDVLYVRMRAPLPHNRLSRHLWRMGFSLFLATAIFFFGNSHVLPEILRTPWVLTPPVLAVVLWTLVYAIRTRFSRNRVQS